MTTSGTVASTIIDTAALIEHAFRRCRVLPSAQTPETVQIAKENLYFLLLNMSNRGLNLWAVEKAFIGLVAGQALYVTQPGTLDVLNVIYTQPTLSASTFAATANGGKATQTATTVLRIGFKFSAAYTGTLTLSSSSDDITYSVFSTLSSDTYAAGIYYWVDIPVATSAIYFKVEGTTAPVSDIVLATVVYDIPCTQWNRDTYAAINAKNQQGRPSTSYFFEKKLTPTLTMWPVPNNSTDHLTIYRHRQPQDVGSLTQTLEIPQRWLDGVIWLLAAKIGFELPGVDPQLLTLLTQMAQQQEFEAEGAESDGAPIFLNPGIRAYSR